MALSTDIISRLLRPATAAQYLGVGVSSLLEIGASPLKLGRRALYDRRDLDRIADDLSAVLADNPFRLAS